jgi:dodecin
VAGSQANDSLAIAQQQKMRRKARVLHASCAAPFICARPHCGGMHRPTESPGTGAVANSFTIKQQLPQRRIAMADTGMTDHVYKILDLVGSSEKSIEDAIQNAIARASQTIREMKWFEVVQTRGHIENGSVRHYQVTLRVGFTLEE